jgi:hypothetical protein
MPATLAPNAAARVPVPSGALYRVIDTVPARNAVRPEVAAEVARTFAIFAREAGATEEAPVMIELRPGIFGHHQVGRAIDVYAVGGRGIGDWMDDWERMLARFARLPGGLERRLLRETEENNNLGWRLYHVMQRHGRWAQPYGHPIQLFGPWTRSEGPWRHISDFLLRAHRDHIHVAK